MTAVDGMKQGDAYRKRRKKQSVILREGDECGRLMVTTDEE